MPARKKVSKTAKNTSANLGFEANLWLAADKLRNNMDAADWNEMIETVLEDSLQGKWGDVHQFDPTSCVVGCLGQWGWGSRLKQSHRAQRVKTRRKQLNQRNLRSWRLAPINMAFHETDIELMDSVIRVQLANFPVPSLNFNIMEWPVGQLECEERLFIKTFPKPIHQPLLAAA